LPWYRVKFAVKVPDDPAKSQRRREAARALIASHGGKDVSSTRPGAKFVAGVFSNAEAAGAFREKARKALRAG
jgi:hypothetical protein